MTNIDAWEPLSRKVAGMTGFRDALALFGNTSGSSRNPRVKPVSASHGFSKTGGYMRATTVQIHAESRI